MILVKLSKDIETQKMFVVQWAWISKAVSLQINNIPGMLMKFDSDDVPNDFYKSSSKYFVEEGILRKYWTEDQLMDNLYK